MGGKLRRAAAAAACMSALCASPALALRDIIIINQAPPPMLQEHLVSTEPGAESKLEKAPAGVVLHFQKPVRKDLTSVKVVDEYGTPMTDGSITVDGPTVTAELSGELRPGRYKVEWRATCACEEQQPLYGTFRFTVLHPQPQ